MPVKFIIVGVAILILVIIIVIATNKKKAKINSDYNRNQQQNEREFYAQVEKLVYEYEKSNLLKLVVQRLGNIDFKNLKSIDIDSYRIRVDYITVPGPTLRFDDLGYDILPDAKHLIAFGRAFLNITKTSEHFSFDDTYIKKGYYNLKIEPNKSPLKGTLE